MIFHDVTLQVGERISARRHDTASLVPGAVAVFSDLLEGNVPGAFRGPIPGHRFEHIELSWTCEEPSGAAMATFFARGSIMTTSLLLSGRDPGESAALHAFQSMIVKLFGGTPLEPSFDVLSIRDRPLLATLPIPRPDIRKPSVQRDMGVIADMETCLAAAFFARMGGDR